MISLSKFLLLFWVIFLGSFRPSIFGEKYNLLVFFLFISTSILLLIVSRRKKIALDKNGFIALSLILFCVSYFAIQGLILSDAKATVINSSVLLLFTVPIMAFILHGFQETVLKFFVQVHFYLSLSAIITFAIYIFVQFSIERLPLIGSLYELVEYAKYDPARLLSNHVIFFPFTVAWSSAGFMGIEVPRFVGIYREPGMAQIFFNTAFILSLFIDFKRKRLVRLVLLIGSILTFSAAGFVNLLLFAVFYIFYSPKSKEQVYKLIKNPIVVVVVMVLFLILAKQSIEMLDERFSQISGQGRLTSFADGFSRLKENLFFGEGYYNSFKKDDNGVIVSASFIGILGVSYQLGLVGVFLYLLPWLFRLLTARRLFVCIYIPCFVTLFFSQPSYNDIFTFFLLLINTKQLSQTPQV
jgi:hypothetical protein